MGFMPHSLEKGPFGLRLDYLAQFQSVRDYVRGRLNNYGSTGNPADHPLQVMRSVQSNIPTSALAVDVLNDPRARFVEQLNYQLTQEATIDPTWSHVGDGTKYLAHNAHLHEYNQDHTGNRWGFLGWWTGGRPGTSLLFTQIASAIVQAIDANQPRLDFWWDCSLADGTPPTADFQVLPPIARVLFRTDHSAIETDPDKTKNPRQPLDP